MVLFSLLEGPSRATGDTHASAHDAVGPEHPGLHVGDVHAPALAVAVTGGLAEKLGRHAIQVEAEGDSVAVTPVGTGYDVAIF